MLSGFLLGILWITIFSNSLLVGFFPKGGDDKAEFEKVASNLFESYKFGFVTSAELAKEYSHEE